MGEACAPEGLDKFDEGAHPSRVAAALVSCSQYETALVSLVSVVSLLLQPRDLPKQKQNKITT